jgi:pilus assembly protein CpaF
LQRINDEFISKQSYLNFLHRVQNESSVQANLDRPFADGYWRDFRLHLILPPVTPNEPKLSLRRHPASPWTLQKLEACAWAPAHAVAKLKELIVAKSSFLIIGGTNSGKTSVLNACLQELPGNERVVIIEDTSEVQNPNFASTKLLSRSDLNGILQNIDLGELLRQALRMRPDRIIIGEVRGNEAKDLMMALSTGHQGGMGTLHAENPRQALIRLEMLIQMGAPQWSLRAIRHLIFFGIRNIVCVAKRDGRRQLEGLYRLTSVEDHGFCIEPLYQITPERLSDAR